LRPKRLVRLARLIIAVKEKVNATLTDEVVELSGAMCEVRPKALERWESEGGVDCQEGGGRRF
jgi:hypothetical protein